MKPDRADGSTSEFGENPVGPVRMS
jgi:hypothetical protein